MCALLPQSFFFFLNFEITPSSSQYCNSFSLCNIFLNRLRVYENPTMDKKTNVIHYFSRICKRGEGNTIRMLENCDIEAFLKSI